MDIDIRKLVYIEYKKNKKRVGTTLFLYALSAGIKPPVFLFY